MATRTEHHIQKAHRNFDSARVEPRADWKVTKLFYAALHMVEAVAAAEGRHSRNHLDREMFLRHGHRREWNHYARLKDRASTARYVPTMFPMTAEQVCHQIEGRHFRAIRLWASARLGRGTFQAADAEGLLAE